MRKIPRWILPQPPASGRKVRWLLTRLAIMFGVMAFIMVSGGLIFKNHLIFFPSSGDFGSPANYGIVHEEKWVPLASGGQVKIWHLPAPATAEGQVKTLLFFQGNSGNMSLLSGRLAVLQSLGFSVWSVDYPGFGESAGWPSEKLVYESAEALWKQAVATDAVQAEDIIIYGFSLGGGVASYLAVEHSPAALVLDSTFTRLRDVPSGYLPFLKPYFQLILGNAFDTKTRLESLSCPLLVLHSRDDDVVPYELGEEVFRTYSGGPKDIARGTGDHLGFFQNASLYLERLKQLK